MLWASVVVTAAENKINSLWALCGTLPWETGALTDPTLHRDHLFPSFLSIKYLTAGLVTAPSWRTPTLLSMPKYLQFTMFSLLWLQFVFMVAVQVAAAPTPGLREFLGQFDEISLLTSTWSSLSQARD